MTKDSLEQFGNWLIENEYQPLNKYNTMWVKIDTSFAKSYVKPVKIWYSTEQLVEKFMKDLNK